MLVLLVDPHACSMCIISDTPSSVSSLSLRLRRLLLPRVTCAYKQTRRGTISRLTKKPFLSAAMPSGQREVRVVLVLVVGED